MALMSSPAMLVANSKALEAAGMKDGMPDIPGGEVGRYADGRLNGYLAEAAMYPLMEKTFGSIASKHWSHGDMTMCINKRWH